MYLSQVKLSKNFLRSYELLQTWSEIFSIIINVHVLRKKMRRILIIQLKICTQGLSPHYLLIATLITGVTNHWLTVSLWATSALMSDGFIQLCRSVTWEEKVTVLYFINSNKTEKQFVKLQNLSVISCRVFASMCVEASFLPSSFKLYNRLMFNGLWESVTSTHWPRRRISSPEKFIQRGLLQTLSCWSCIRHHVRTHQRKTPVILASRLPMSRNFVCRTGRRMKVCRCLMSGHYLLDLWCCELRSSSLALQLFEAFWFIFF